MYSCQKKQTTSSRRGQHAAPISKLWYRRLVGALQVWHRLIAGAVARSLRCTLTLRRPPNRLQLRLNLIHDKRQIGVQCAIKSIAHRAALMTVLARARAAHPIAHSLGIWLDRSRVCPCHDRDDRLQILEHRARARRHKTARMRRRISDTGRAECGLKSAADSIQVRRHDDGLPSAGGKRWPGNGTGQTRTADPGRKTGPKPSYLSVAIQSARQQREIFHFQPK